MSSAYNKKWASCPTFLLMDGIPHTYLDTLQWDHVGAGVFSPNWRWSFISSSFVILEVSKPLWSQIMDFFFLLLEECTKSVAMMIRIGDGLCKSNSEEGLVWK